nr:anthocyanidin reductase ((2s)-flavan-3-ol-forming) [Quercus suber]
MKKRALEPDEPRSHIKNRGVGISKQCKACEKLGHNRRSCKGEVGGNSSLPGSASQVSRTTRRAAKDGHANSQAVGSAQLSSTDDVTTTAPLPPTDNQSNPRPKRQRKRSVVTTETLHASRNAARYPYASLQLCRSVKHILSHSGLYSFGDFPSKAKLTLSLEKLIKEGFRFKYGIEDIYDQTVEYFKAKGLLQI